MSLKSTSTPVSFPMTADCSHKPLREIAAPKNKGLRQPAHGDRNIRNDFAGFDRLEICPLAQGISNYRLRS